ncbi:MAG: hypothetical protein GY811_18590 [Myxococcales bacterium]|nr:hypothetical protein [Myxococcales bacterium]
MPAFLLCALLLGATTLAWAQTSVDERATTAPRSSPPVSLAAIEAIAQGEAKWRDLEVLARGAAQPDRVLAGPAALTASELAHTLDAFDIDAKEIPRASLRTLEAQWLEIATNSERWVDIRIYALDVASRLDKLLRLHGGLPQASLWTAFLEDADPQMRAAALVFVPDADELVQVAIEMLLEDTSEEVSLAAGQRLCGPLRIAPTGLPSIDAKAVHQLQVLASNNRLPVVSRAHLAPCLLADASLPSRRALGLLLQKSPPALRRHLNELTRVPIASGQP